MTNMGCRASRAPHHFVLKCVLPGQFDIDGTNTLNSVVRMCYTVNTMGDFSGTLKQNPVCAQWFESWRNLNIHYPLIDKKGMGSVITCASHAYVVSLTNHLMYGLRDHYVALLRFLGMNHHEVVALTMLDGFVRNGPQYFWFKLTKEDVEEATKSHDNQPEINSQVAEEIQMMGRVDSTYTSALRLLHRIKQRYDKR